ncbi:hypothetical protein ACJDU8_13340 [Clostridium sp. WILCCON 0269]|uniref:Uncharacterized protein n=1 Tax=Candidatus Clostridium eludens TaxID=3381663 RepID=A0ABW8SLH9_9CLOT
MWITQSGARLLLFLAFDLGFATSVNVSPLFKKYISERYEEVKILMNEHTYVPNLDLKND